MSVTAKVVLHTKTQQLTDTRLEFTADYKDGRNQEWAQYTPTLQMSMTVKPEIGEQFPIGGAYTLTFTPEES